MLFHHVESINNIIVFLVAEIIAIYYESCNSS